KPPAAVFATDAPLCAFDSTYIRDVLMKAKIAVLPGDGIGPEVMAQGLRCLRAVADTHGHELAVTELPFGGAAIDLCGNPLPQSTLKACLEADGVLLGAIGG